VFFLYIEIRSIDVEYLLSISNLLSDTSKLVIPTNGIFYKICDENRQDIERQIQYKKIPICIKQS
jgi:hypothetical protein